LRYNRGGFARIEWTKHPRDPNEALDLRCYARAAFEYLKVPLLERMPRNVLRNLAPANIEQMEVGAGKVIFAKGGTVQKNL
jgi:phage terminase large subunit GpA-like protein